MLPNSSSKAKAYQRVKLWLTLVNFLLTLFLLAAAVVTGLSVWFRDVAVSFSSFSLISAGIYFALFSLYFLIFDYPLSVYSGYILEKKFELSNQTFWAWNLETLKKSLLSFGIALVLIEIFFGIVRSFPNQWWWMIWLVWTLFSLVFGRLAPVLIFPLFYKFKPLENPDLRQRILNLVRSNGLKLENVYVFNMSKTTKKANAAFCGMGKTQRVILGDTLVENFTPEEIEVVVAHEMGHCKLHHLWKRVFWMTFISLAAFFLAYKICGNIALKLGYDGMSDLASLPLIFLVFFLMSLLAMPFENAYSRKHEFEADDFAYEKTQYRSACIPLMEKLGSQNLADPDPHPLIEFLLYDHPSIGKRIQHFRVRGA